MGGKVESMVNVSQEGLASSRYLNSDDYKARRVKEGFKSWRLNCTSSSSSKKFKVKVNDNPITTEEFQQLSTCIDDVPSTGDETFTT